MALIDSNRTDSNDCTVVVVADNTNPNNKASVTAAGAVLVKIDGVVNSTSAPQSYEMYSVGREIDMPSSTIDNPMLLLRNPSNSAIRIMVWQLFVGIYTPNTSAMFKIFSNPTVTAFGLSVAPAARKIGTTVTAKTLASVTPTVTNSGTPLQVHLTGQNVASTTMVAEFSIMVEPGHSLLVTGAGTSNNRSGAISLVWTEVPV